MVTGNGIVRRNGYPVPIKTIMISIIFRKKKTRNRNKENNIITNNGLSIVLTVAFP